MYEARFRALFEHAQNGVLVADPTSVYLDANPAVCRMLGYTRAELIGLHATDIVSPAEADEVPVALRQLNGHLDHQRRWRFRRKDGTELLADVVATQLPDGTLLGLLSDLSDREEARTYRERMAALVESSLDAIASEDLDGTLTTWNAGAEAMFGYTADEMVGRPVLRVFPPERVHEESMVLDKVLRGERVDRFETVRRTKDGREIDVAVTVSPIRAGDGRVIGASKIARDISALKAREREIDRLSCLYAALTHVNQAIVWSRSRDSLFDSVCKALVDHGMFRLAWIGWLDREANQLVPVAAHGDAGYLDELPLTLGADAAAPGEPPYERALRSGRPYICNVIQEDPGVAAWRGGLERRGFGALAVLPVRLAGAVVGVLSVYSEHRDVFQDREISLLQGASADVSFALENLEREQQRRSAEQRLRDEKLFSDTMIESMPGVLYFYDSAGHFLRWNRNFERVTCYTAEEIARMHPTEVIAEADRAAVSDRIADVFRVGESSLEASLLSKSGTTTPYFFTGRRVEFDGRPCLIGVGIDISERKRAEARVLESESRLLEAQRLARIGSWELDPETRRVLSSDTVWQMLGLDPAASEGTLDTYLALVHPQDRERVRAANLRALTGEEELDVEHRLLLPDGSERVVHQLGTMRRDDEGRPIALASTLNDVTDRVRMEAEREKRHQAEAADRVKSAFLATMSHELRTPLNSIIGFTGIMLQGLAGPLNDEQSKQLGMVRQSARHLLALVNDVLDISKIEAGQLKVANETFDVTHAIRHALTLVAPQVAAKQLTLEARLAPDLGSAVGDHRRFTQVLMNLLSNAIKFTEAGTIAVEADLIAAGDAPDSPSSRAVRVSVTDTGVGIGVDDLPRLFQPFQQIDSTSSRPQEGTGLGLAISRRLANLMGGDVTAQSEAGIGSTFTMTLPLDARTDE